MLDNAKAVKIIEIIGAKLVFIKEGEVGQILNYVIAIPGTGKAVEPRVAEVDVRHEHVAGVQYEGVVLVHGQPGVACV